MSAPLTRSIATTAALFVTVGAHSGALAQEIIDFTGVTAGGTSLTLDTNGDSVDDLIIASQANSTLSIANFASSFAYSEVPVLAHTPANGPEIKLTFLNGLTGSLEFGYTTALNCGSETGPVSGFPAKYDMKATVELFSANDTSLGSTSVPAECTSTAGTPRYAEGKVVIQAPSEASYALINYESSDASFVNFSIDNLTGNFSNTVVAAPNARSVPALPLSAMWVLIGGLAMIARRVLTK